MEVATNHHHHDSIVVTEEGAEGVEEEARTGTTASLASMTRQGIRKSSRAPTQCQFSVWKESGLRELPISSRTT
jgi:hypothetical protein